MEDRDGGHGTKVREPALRADAFEADLLERFSAHDALAGVEGMSDDAFLEMLLQRRFLSLLFPVMYDLGIDALDDEGAVRLVREILREEYPDASGATPSHREDLVSDLLVLGASRGLILSSRPSAVTAGVIEETLEIMREASVEAGDAAVLTILRFWGEVLVSVEYGEFWRRMEERFAAAGVTSRFYHPHHHHDGREPLAAASESSRTHSGRLGSSLVRLLDGDGHLEAFERVESRVLDMRLRFYDQFVL